jgi:hypothetical protein
LQHSRSPTLAQINAVLLAACLDFDFLWTWFTIRYTARCEIWSKSLILPISDIEGFNGTSTVANGVNESDYGNGLAGWLVDVQVFELV